jgi:methyl-accepting chemotaxis protein
MVRTRTIGQRLGGVFAGLLGLCILIAGVSVEALHAVARDKDRVVDVNAHFLFEAATLQNLNERYISNIRAFVIAQQQHFLDVLGEMNAAFQATTASLSSEASDDAAARQVSVIRKAQADQSEVADKIVALRKAGAPTEILAEFLDVKLQVKRNALRQAIEAFVASEAEHLKRAQIASSERASRAIQIVVGCVAVALLVTTPLLIFFLRSLTRQIGSAITSISSASAELQVSATQQATASQEQGAATMEVTTTMKELFASSRQIAESSQQVAKMSQQAASASRESQSWVRQAEQGMATIQSEVDAVVANILELAKKTEKIGQIVMLINEFAEQTDILATNATIEAVRAGDVGARFGMVAGEVRKLAENVGNAARGIDALVAEIGATARTGSDVTREATRVVSEGAKQVGALTLRFEKISALVSASSEAAREIELSTKQQATAMEQVTDAVSDVAQTARQTQVSAAQTLTASSQLTLLAQELTRLVQVSSYQNALGARESP